MTSDLKNDTFFSLCGLLSAIVFPMATLAQLYKTIRTKTAGDISYGW